MDSSIIFIKTNLDPVQKIWWIEDDLSAKNVWKPLLDICQIEVNDSVVNDVATSKSRTNTFYTTTKLSDAN